MATNNLISIAQSMASPQSNQLYQSVIGFKREAAFASETNDKGKLPAKRPHYGKCQYKTGKCLNERTTKRNGEAHSLCEEHRAKQNSIQRRSDRKYQTVHAVRRRERSQRRAELKKQVSIAVAQQLFHEHQHQKKVGHPLPQHHPLYLLTSDAKDAALMNLSANKIENLAPPIQVPSPGLMIDDHIDYESSLVLSVEPQSSIIEAANSKIKIAHEPSPTGIDNPTSNMFPTIPKGHSMPTLRDDEVGVSSALSDNFGFMPILSYPSDKESWSDDDIEFLQTILLT